MLNIVIDNPKIEKFLNYSPDEAKKNLEIFCETQIERKTTETVKKYHELNDFLAKKENTLKICESVDIYEIIRIVTFNKADFKKLKKHTKVSVEILD